MPTSEVDVEDCPSLPPNKNLILRKAESMVRVKGMRHLLRKNLGFNYMEDFAQNSASMGRSTTKQGKEEADVIKKLMEKKIRDERRHLKKLIKEERREREIMKKNCGRKQYQRMMKGRRMVKERKKTEMTEKYKKKIENIEKKYGEKVMERKSDGKPIHKYKERYKDMDAYKEDEEEMSMEELNEQQEKDIPVVGNIVMTPAMKHVLKHPPKTRLNKDLDIKDLLEELETAAAKTRWDLQRIQQFNGSENDE